MAKVTELKMTDKKLTRLQEIAKKNSDREKRMFELQKSVKKGKKNPSLYAGPRGTEGSKGDLVNRINRKGGGAATHGLGRAFMKGGKV